MSSYFSKRTVLAGRHRLSRAPTRFRRIFISRARKSSAECSFRSGKRTRKKESFSARREITFTAQKGRSYLSRCRNDPEKIAMILLTWPTIRPAKRYGGCEFSFYYTWFLFFVHRVFFFTPLGLSLMFIFFYVTSKTTMWKKSSLCLKAIFFIVFFVKNSS